MKRTRYLLAAFVADISRDAMQIICERNRDCLLRSTRFGPPDGKPLMVVVSVQLPVQTGFSNLTTVCEFFPRESYEDGGALFALRFFISMRTPSTL